MACMLAAARAAPVAEPEAFFPLGALAIPALTGSALLDGILLGKVAFLKGKQRDSTRPWGGLRRSQFGTLGRLIIQLV